MTESVAAIDNDLWRPFWQAAEERRLVLPFCCVGDRAFWPPSPISPYAGGCEVEWREVARRGRLVSRIVTRRGFQQAFGDLLPYAIGLVELAGDVRLCAHLSDPEAAAPDDIVGLEFRVLVDGGQSVLTIVASD
ncbi:Zn-ribbon domain-containing OB-fold protein [Sphingosinithalassobacter portus]|uniref:Zn-ribbon domain-containing OB-fold protein n=1 Tax=Stakelama portus TaxID=2676234 RepID=UPI000D6DFD53|nr:OB-fold domain-containing protein [Sphingosinithalassobacter portus]